MLYPAMPPIWDFFSDVAEPYVVVLNATRKIALGPVFIVWLGATVKAVIALFTTTA
jgi:NitT/TauT family transport system permease protein